MNKNLDVWNNSFASFFFLYILDFCLDQFLVEGVPVQDFFNHEKENYSQEKELEKARKQLARGLTPTTTHAQANIKRLEMSTKTPGRQQNHLGKEVKYSFFSSINIGKDFFFLLLFRVKSKQQHHFDRRVEFKNVN